LDNTLLESDMIYKDMMNLRNLFIAVDTLSHEFSFNTVYDIGASDGIFSRVVAQFLEPHTKFHLFEPIERDAVENNYKHEWHRVFLSDSKKEVDFYSGDHSIINGNSYYKEVTGHFDKIDPIKVSTTTLDSYVAKNNLELPDIIKIDTQGSELDILKGAEECLKFASLVILEVPILRYNEGAPSITDIISYMLTQKFVPFKTLQDHYYNDEMMNRCLIQQDMAFIKIQQSPEYINNRLGKF